MRVRRIVTSVVLGTCLTLLGAGTAEAFTTNPVPTPAGSEAFGSDLLVLTNGNYVLVDQLWDSPTSADVGAVRLYNGVTNQLISTLTGSEPGDAVGSHGVTEVGGGNLVVRSGAWHGGRGAVTWMNGTTGLDGAVSAANSLVGTSAGDGVGVADVTVLAGGDFVVTSPSWDNGSVVDAGAVTWASGATGGSGAVSPANSLVGSQTSDMVGEAGATGLVNGSYVVASPSWSADRGAATWAGATGTTVGVVSALNSLVGSSPGDRVSVNGVVPLANGNYVVASSGWAFGGADNAGAVTWGSGAGGTTGVVSDANSLVGTEAGDFVGAGVVALTNGNYVVGSPNWNNGGVPSAGAATFAGGTTGITGPVTAANSLVGSTTGDQVASGGVTALTNGNFVVGSPNWDDGAVADAGAATWSDGTVSGTVSTANSVYGSFDQSYVGDGSVALTNGNYLVRSPRWTDGVTANLGAVTWLDGAGAASGAVSAANSLIGDLANDSVGAAITALSNGNAVVSSVAWHGNTGAATWVDGGAGLIGVVSDSNSLVGAAPGDRVGREGITELSDGNYVVGSNSWKLGPTEVGALTWGSGSTGRTGLVSAANSLVGSSAFDEVGSNVTVLSGGRYATVTSSWDSGSMANAGAVTYGPPGGVYGPIDSTNSVLGQQADTDFRIGSRLTADNSILIGSVKNGTTLLQLDDVNPPLINTHPDLSAVAAPGATGVAVSYAAPQAIDGHGPVTVSCNPPSGALFPIGVTTVQCTATDGASLQASTTFTVTVTSATDFVPLAPARLADTRPGFATVDGQFAGGGKLAANGTLELVVAGRGGVAADAVAAALNVTVTGADAPGFLTVFPCGAPQPTASNLNYVAGATVPNAVVAKIGADGKVCVFSQSAAHVIVDVNGSFPATTSMISINPARLLETRPGLTTVDGQQQGVGMRAGGSVTAVRVIDRAGVPADASAVVLNVTVTGPLAPGYLTVFPCGDEPPTASSLNYVDGATVANLAVSKVGTNGNICVFTQSATHLVVDIAGYFPAVTSYNPLVPARLLDTRPGFPTIDDGDSGAGVRALGTVTTLQVTGRGGVPAGAASVVLNVTVTAPAAAGFVTAYPCGIDPPLASNLNFAKGQTIANAVIVKLGPGGTVCLFNSQATHLIVDVNGFLPG